MTNEEEAASQRGDYKQSATLKAQRLSLEKEYEKSRNKWP